MQLKVFISSRLEELEEERKAVEKAVSELWTHENLPFTIWGWESAKEIPSGKHPGKVQSKGVRDSDIYVLILGSEYGDAEYGGTPTHKEYTIAYSELEEDCFLIYIKEVGRREEKLEKWIEELKNKHTFKSFVNPYQLKDLAKTRLRDLWNKGKWKASMPTIQSVLRKGETSEGDFFKKEPEWIDFEEGFVVERKEVDEIIKKLENDNIQLVLGEPASGKSVILKNIGLKLAKENKDVYIVELKKHSGDDVKRYFDAIPAIKGEKVVFIVDDAHLLPAECERLVKDFKFKSNKLETKLIVGSRETRKIRGEHPKEASEFEYLSKTYIRAEDVTEEMINTFLKRKHHFSDERIKRVSRNLNEYKKDLWHLSWTLKAYNPEKNSVEESEIYKKVKDSIRNISAGKEKTEINAEDIFLPLSVFYRFEIPVERSFLEEQTGIKGDILNQLIGLSEIIETEEIGQGKTLSLIHSSIADLYFKTYQNYPDLGRNVKNIFQKGDSDVEYPLFYQYINSVPINSLDVLIHLGDDYFNEKGGQTLLKKLIEDKEIENSIKEAIEKKENIENVGSCIMLITEANEGVGLKLADRIDIDALSSKIEKEEDILEIGWCAGSIAAASEVAGLKLANHVNINILLAKIEREKYMWKVGWCVWGIAKANEEVGLELANRVNIDFLSSKIEKEELENIWWCVRNIAKASEEVALKLVDRIGIDNLISKVEKEEDIWKVGCWVGDIAKASEEVALKLVDMVLARIKKEEDVLKIGLCVSYIAKGSEEVALKLVDAVSSKIEKEENIKHVGFCVMHIAEINENVAQEIANRLNLELRECLESLFTI